MNNAVSITLSKSLAAPFYRQNAGLFLLLFILLFGVIPGGQQLTYHYRLIMGMLSTRAIYFGVVVIWIIYAVKCTAFVSAALEQEQYRFLQVLDGYGRLALWNKLLGLELVLHAPVGGYALIISAVAFSNHFWLGGIGVLAINITLILTCTGYFYRLLFNPGLSRNYWRSITGLRWLKLRKPYFAFFLLYILSELKLAWLGCKMLSCAALYMLINTLSAADYDLRMPYLIFGAGLFAHSYLLFKCREMELTRLRFYDNLPIATVNRHIQLALFCLVLLLPEAWVISQVSPFPLHTRDALNFLLFAYSMVFFLLTLLYCTHIDLGEYVRMMFGLFIVLYFFVLGGAVFWISLCLLLSSIILFPLLYYSRKN